MNAIDKSLRQDMMICLYDITKKDCYKQLLKNAKKSIVKRLFENGDEKQLIRFFSFGFFASKSLDNFIKLASEKEMVVLVSYLLEEQKKKSPKNQQNLIFKHAPGISCRAFLCYGKFCILDL